MSSRELVYILKLQDAASGNARKIAASFDDVTAKSKRVEDAMNRAREAQERLAKAQEEYKRRVVDFSKLPHAELTEKEEAAWKKFAETLRRNVTRAEKDAANAAKEAERAIKDLSRAEERASQEAKTAARETSRIGRALDALSRGNIRGAISALGGLGSKLLMLGGIVTGVVAVFRLVGSQIQKMANEAHRAKMDSLKKSMEETSRAANETAKEIKRLYDNIDRLAAKAKEKIDFRVRVGDAQRRGANAGDEAAWQRQDGQASEAAGAEMQAGRARQRLVSQGFATHGSYESRRRALEQERLSLDAKDSADESMTDAAFSELSSRVREVYAARARNIEAQNELATAGNSLNPLASEEDAKQHVQETEAALREAEEALQAFYAKADERTREVMAREQRRVEIEHELIALKEEEKADMAEIAAASAALEASEARRARALEDAERERARAAESARAEQERAVRGIVLDSGNDKNAQQEWALAPYRDRAALATSARETAESEIEDLRSKMEGASTDEYARIQAEIVVKERELLALKDNEVAAQREVGVQQARLQQTAMRENEANRDRLQGELKAAEGRRDAQVAANADDRVAEALAMFATTPEQRRSARREERRRERAIRKAERTRARAIDAYREMTGTDDLTAFSDGTFEEKIKRLPRAQREMLKRERERQLAEQRANQEVRQIQQDLSVANGRLLEQNNTLDQILNALKGNLAGLANISVVNAGAEEGYTGQ